MHTLKLDDLEAKVLDASESEKAMQVIEDEIKRKFLSYSKMTIMVSGGKIKKFVDIIREANSLSKKCEDIPGEIRNGYILNYITWMTTIIQDFDPGFFELYFVNAGNLGLFASDSDRILQGSFSPQQKQAALNNQRIFYAQAEYHMKRAIELFERFAVDKDPNAKAYMTKMKSELALIYDNQIDSIMLARNLGLDKPAPKPINLAIAKKCVNLCYNVFRSDIFFSDDEAVDMAITLSRVFCNLPSSEHLKKSILYLEAARPHLHEEYAARKVDETIKYLKAEDPKMYDAIAAIYNDYKGLDEN